MNYALKLVNEISLYYDARSQNIKIGLCCLELVKSKGQCINTEHMNIVLLNNKFKHNSVQDNI